MNHNDPDMNIDDLDEQIRAALRVERSPQQLARLARFWQRQSHAEIRRRRIRRVVTVAAALVAVAVSVRLWRQEPAQQPLETNRPTAVIAAVPDPIRGNMPERNVAVKSSPEKKPLSAGRPATTYERFVFAARARTPLAEKRSSVAAIIDEVIEQLGRDPDADAAQLAESSGLMECGAERLLLRRLPRSNDDQKHAVLQLLAVCGTPRSTPHLLRLCRRETFRDEALATLERIVGVERLADVVGQATDRRVRIAIIHRLLTADSELALRGYLSLIHNDAICGEALAVADAAARPFTRELLTLLDDEDESVRISAALVLGHINGPDVTNSLIDRVTREPSSPTEVWIALLACRGARADEFFAYATRQPQLLGQVNLARVRWAIMTH